MTEHQLVSDRYRRLRLQLLVTTFVGYALYYFCRKNISLVLPTLGKELHYSNTQLGLLGSLLYITYGAGKFVNGVLGDHLNPRRLMALGLLLSAISCALFGASHSLLLFSICWALNGWFQSMGFPPCARILSNYFSVSERGFIWSI